MSEKFMKSSVFAVVGGMLLTFGVTIYCNLKNDKRQEAICGEQLKALKAANKAYEEIEKE